MSKVFSIGRDPSCDICIYDSTNVVSRSHATLRVDKRKYYITDHSTNGTYRNGMRLTPNMEYQITKDDDVLLGGTYRLDFNMIPKPDKSVGTSLLYTAIIFLLAALVLSAIYLLPRFQDKRGGGPAMIEHQRDSVAVKQKPDSLVVLEDKSLKPKTKKKAVERKQSSKVQNQPSASKKNIKDYTDEDDNQNLDAI